MQRRLTLLLDVDDDAHARACELVELVVGGDGYMPHPTDGYDDRTTVTLFDIDDNQLLRILTNLGEVQIYTLLDYAPEGQFVFVRDV